MARWLAGIFLCGVTFFSQAQALNIVLVNDDSFETRNIQRLRLKLIAAGHQVLVSVPCAHQSGKGGSLGSYLTPMPVHPLKVADDGELMITEGNEAGVGYCVGDTEAEKSTKTFKDYRDGTPLQAAAHGIYEAEQRWGAKPDLVISGPNEGRNVGFAVFLSGTLGAAHYAIANQVPAIAVSAGSTPADAEPAIKHADLVADRVLKILDHLIDRREPGQPLLPQHTGLNVNTPDFDVLAEAPARLSQVNWYFGNALVWGDLTLAGSAGERLYAAKLAGQSRKIYGLNIIPSTDMTGDDRSLSEGRLAEAGFVSISVIDATENASEEKTKAVAELLDALKKN